MTETTFDPELRYLVPVARLQLPTQPDDTHWSVYQWLPGFEAWATGPAICGYSTAQGPLPEGTAVTCQRCEERRPDYERYLAPGYRPEGDDRKALRTRTEGAEGRQGDGAVRGRGPVMGQLELDIPAAPVGEEPGPRTYWEHHGPRDWRPVTVRVRYGDTAGLAEPVFPEVHTSAAAPRNVLVERADGTRAVRPVRLLRVHCPT